MEYNQLLFVIYLAILVFMSLISLFLFKKDKSLAKSGNQNRIKEKTLLESVVLGGSIGAFIGRILFHHKTDKKYFSMVIYFSMLLQIAVAVALLALMLM